MVTELLEKAMELHSSSICNNVSNLMEQRMVNDTIKLFKHGLNVVLLVKKTTLINRTKLKYSLFLNLGAQIYH